MKSTNVASSSISLVWPMCALSNSTSDVATMHAGKLYPDSHIIQNTVVTVNEPMRAGIERYAT
jgi:hypothetical protein